MPEKQFIGRSSELDGRQRRYEQDGAQMVLVYGRRRVGRSYLLEQFATGKPMIFYQATQQTEASELAGFTAAVRAFLGEGGLPPGYDFPGWGEALDFLSARNGERLVVILDQFPYLAASTTGLPSIVQRWWDQKGRASNLMLILCGSAPRFMEGLDGAAAPPQSGCRPEVNGESRTWGNGQCVIFDDFMAHEVWNESDDERIVLVVDLWHPNLTDAEIELLKGLHRFVSAQTENV
jgi:hypothetical protein